MATLFFLPGIFGLDALNPALRLISAQMTGYVSTMQRQIIKSKTRPVLAALLAAPALFVSGCVSGANDYDRAAIGVPYEIVPGRLVAIEPVNIQGRQSGIGAASGAALGGALGSRIGDRRDYYGGNRTNVAGAIGFAILGGLVGAAIEDGATGGRGYRYSVELDDGRVISVVQGDRQPVAPVGADVRVEYGRNVRVLPG